ncbi:MAG TPA: uL22 family ribosomal protein, partial [Candidatus Dormibacteraeota bacterium]
VAKVIRSAQANAENNFNLVRDDLVIKEIRVEAGPMLKRGQPRAMGRLFSIFKRTSHITAVIEDRPGVARRRPASLPRAPQAAGRPAPATPAPSRRGTRATTAPEPATTESDEVEEAPKPRRTRGEATKADQARPEKGKTSTQSKKKDDVKKESKEKKGK